MVPSKNGPFLVYSSFLHVKTGDGTSLPLDLISLPSLLVNDLLADSTSEGSRSCIKSIRAA